MPEAESEVILLTLERAVSMYFEQQAKKLGPPDRMAVTRFVSWCGPTRTLSALTPHDVTLFQEALGQNAADLSQRLLPVKAFFSHAKRRTWTNTNLGVHLRVKRDVRRLRDEAMQAAETEAAAAPDDDAVQFTASGLKTAREELDRLRAERPKIASDLTEAMADKDFRENAPLDAARDAQAMLEARIRDLEQKVARSVVVDGQASGPGVAHIGSCVEVTNLGTDRDGRYTLVGQTEVDAAAGKISVASPMGKALVGRRKGDEVSVAAPSGTIRFRIGSIDG